MQIRWHSAAILSKPFKTSRPARKSDGDETFLEDRSLWSLGQRLDTVNVDLCTPDPGRAVTAGSGLQIIIRWADFFTGPQEPL
jgi:hypothetical protein